MIAHVGFGWPRGEGCQQHTGDQTRWWKSEVFGLIDALSGTSSIQGMRKFHFALSLFGSNFTSAGVLAPIAVSATGPVELGIDFGMMR